MAIIQVTVKIEVEVDDAHDKEIVKERVHEHIRDLIDEDELEFKTKILVDDEDEDDEEELDFEDEDED